MYAVACSIEAPKAVNTDHAHADRITAEENIGAGVHD